MTPGLPGPPPGSMGIPSENCYFIEILRQDRAEKESIWAPRCVPFWALPPRKRPQYCFFNYFDSSSPTLGA